MRERATIRLAADLLRELLGFGETLFMSGFTVSGSATGPIASET
jgi:hypothetical protein